MSFLVKVWGIRGSLPSPRTPEQIFSKIKRFILRALDKGVTPQGVDGFLREYPLYKVGGFGGHTACIQVHCPRENKSLIIDAGSGIRRLGAQLVCGPAGLGKAEIHLLFTHFHWDHLIGLPFFTPIFIPGNTIHIHAVQEDLEPIIRSLFKKPYFPVPYEALGAEIVFHKLAPRRRHQIEDFDVTPYQLDHPDPCWGFKIEKDNKVFSYCIDTEGTRVSPKELGEDLPLYQNVDVMLFDAQYSFLEAEDKVDWGHASAPIGLDIAIREKVKRLYFGHHDPAAPDEKIYRVLEQTKDYYDNLVQGLKTSQRQLPELEWDFAYEGMEIEV